MLGSFSLSPVPPVGRSAVIRLENSQPSNSGHTTSEKPLGLKSCLTFIVHFYLFVPPAWHITCRTCVKTVSERKHEVASSNRQPEKKSKGFLLSGLKGAAFTCKFGCWALLGNVWMQRFRSVLRLVSGVSSRPDHPSHSYPAMPLHP